jgi:hypothetical protein
VALTRPQWSTAFAAAKLVVGQTPLGLDAHKLVLRGAVRALERRCFGHRHGVGEVLLEGVTSQVDLQQRW